MATLMEMPAETVTEVTELSLISYECKMYIHIYIYINIINTRII